MERDDESYLQQSLTKTIESLGNHLDNIHKCSLEKEKIIILLQNILKESTNYECLDCIISYLGLIVIPKLKNVLEIVCILEKIPWRAKDNDIKVGDRIPPPPLILSILHFRIIYTIIEMIWVLGVKSYLKNVIDYNFIDDIYPKTLILNQNEIECMVSSINQNNEIKCLECIKIMGSILANKLFKATMLKRNLKRVILSLLILTAYPSSNEETKINLNNDSIQLAHTLLDTFTINFPERIMVIKALRWASSGPPFLRNAACNIMTKILLSNGGLETVLVGYLEGLNDDNKTLPLQMNVAKLITAIPKGYHKETYLQSICTQLVKLMSLGCEKEDKLLMKVCIMIINRIAISSPSLCDTYLIRSFSEPLMRLYSQDIDINIDSSEDQIIASEKEIDISIRIIYNIIYIAPLTPALTASISRSGLGQVLLAIYCQTIQSAKSCQWLQLLQNFSIQYLCNLDPNISSMELRNIILFSTKNKISSAPNGGICIKRGTSDCHNTTTIINNTNNKQTISLTPESILQFKRDESLLENNFNDENNNDIDMSELQKIEEMIMNTAAFSNEQFSDLNVIDENLLTGQRMMFVGNRAKLITDLLLRIEKITSTCSKDEEKSDQDLSNSVASKLFIATLESFLGINIINEKGGININDEYDGSLNHDKITGDGLLRGLDGIIVVTLQGHCEMSMLLRNGVQVIKLLGSFLYSHLQYLDDENATITKMETNLIIEDLDDSEDIDRKETCSTALSLLASILALGNATRPVDEENEIKSLLLPLQRISMKEKDKSIAESASDTAFMILNRAAGGLDNANNKSYEKVRKTINETIIESQEYLNSSSPAMRSYAIRLISIALYESENKSECITEEVFDVLYKMLNDSDSFVYLHVLQVLTRLADFDRQKVFNALLSAFQTDTGNDSSLPERRRSLIGEALSSILRKSGDIAPKFVPFIVVACIKLIKKRLDIKDENRVEEIIDLRNMKINRTNDENIEDDEDLKSIRKNERKNEMNEIKILDAALSADSVLLRQSAISLLAEAISTAGWSAANYMIDTLDIAVGILTFEMKLTQANRSIRR